MIIAWFSHKFKGGTGKYPLGKGWLFAWNIPYVGVKRTVAPSCCGMTHKDYEKYYVNQCERNIKNASCGEQILKLVKM